METVGINATLLAAQICNVMLLLMWPLLSIGALMSLRRRGLPETPTVLWALLIVIVPILGAAALWIVNPRRQPRDA